MAESERLMIEYKVLRVSYSKVQTNMTHIEQENNSAFRNAVEGLLAGDYSRLEPLFDDRNGRPCQIVEWYEAGMFANEPKALDEALSCACFVGRRSVVEYLLAEGVSAVG